MASSRRLRARSRERARSAPTCSTRYCTDMSWLTTACPIRAAGRSTFAARQRRSFREASVRKRRAPPRASGVPPRAAARNLCLRCIVQAVGLVQLGELERRDERASRFRATPRRARNAVPHSPDTGDGLPDSPADSNAVRRMWRGGTASSATFGLLVTNFSRIGNISAVASSGFLVGQRKRDICLEIFSHSRVAW